MAKLIKPDGTEQEVQPLNGTELTLEELRACVEGSSQKSGAEKTDHSDESRPEAPSSSDNQRSQTTLPRIIEKIRVEGHIEAVPYTTGMVMYVNDESALVGLPYNTKASQLLKEKQPTRVHTDVYGNALIATLRETGDTSNVLHVQTVPVNIPCDECKGTAYPNLQWNLYGMKGVLCRGCMAKEVDNVNHTINDTPW